MMRLLRVELTRFRSRRINMVAVLGIVGIALVMMFGTWQNTKPPSAEAMENFNYNVQQWEETGEQQIADCKEGEQAELEVNPEAYWGCDTMTGPTLENWFYPTPTFAENAASVLPNFGFVLVFAAFAMGVSFIAAEFSSGAIGNWLTFEPRRGRVYGTKVGASGISMIPIALVTGAFVLGGTWLANSLNDHVGTVTGDTWRDLGQSGLRVLAVTVAFAMLGVAIGTIVRHTAAALGIILGYVIVVEGIVGGLFQSVRPWLLQLNLQAVLSGGASYSVLECEPNLTGGEMCTTVEKALSLSHGATTIGLVLVVAVVVAALVFRRRDVH